MKLGDECKACGLTVTKEHKVTTPLPWGDETTFVDPCLGKLPGVTFACCGHGGDSKGYIAFENGVVLRRIQMDQVEINHGWQPGMKFDKAKQSIVRIIKKCKVNIQSNVK